MSSAAHQSAIHLLTAHLPVNPVQRIRILVLVGHHEAECVAEEQSDPDCPPCQFGHRCQLGEGCPIRDLEHRHG
ncbi:hypothetical protein [Azohydromonas caseinilytica]|uniref:Uncharacterized protein n=1 Tax=Azohydromonas caseinilytica TaxID=2728836 RepID=A0A848FFQ4_9BURK|nr:hypothetical protein [Azohydromonas caseinilytica]NML16980.1 hypothetical protein [Azohydromonas caseinilytica]